MPHVFYRICNNEILLTTTAKLQSYRKVEVCNKIPYSKIPVAVVARIVLI